MGDCAGAGCCMALSLFFSAGWLVGYQTTLISGPGDQGLVPACLSVCLYNHAIRTVPRLVLFCLPSRSTASRSS